MKKSFRFFTSPQDTEKKAGQHFTHILKLNTIQDRLPTKSGPLVGLDELAGVLDDGVKEHCLDAALKRTSNQEKRLKQMLRGANGVRGAN